MICSFGLSAQFYRDSLKWLDEHPQRRLVFVEDREIPVDPILQNDPRVRIYQIESPLQIEKFASEIAWQSVFFPLEIVSNSESVLFPFFKETLENKHAAANLQLNDAADFGCASILNAKTNLSRPFRSILDLKNAFQNIPAILVGAGPSLEKNGHLLKKFSSKAILFAGGHAIEKIEQKPHFAVLLDKTHVLSSPRYKNIPLCFQARMHPDNFSFFQGDALLAPDSHFPFLNFLSGDKDLFESGWTVGNFSSALAIFFGCNPIICVGMDYCYQEGRKYAFEGSLEEKGLIPALDRNGNSVLTQTDWLMAISWMKDLSKENPKTTFLNATEGGMEYFPCHRLEDLDLEEIPNLQEKINKAIGKAKISSAPKWPLWKEVFRESGFQEEFFLPLWQLWKPIFARETDPYPISFEDKMKIHRALFFEQVIQEYLNVLG